ncbi:MAG: CRISPR-associated endonuclease Cas6 [Fidelibacterota bacterium]
MSDNKYKIKSVVARLVTDKPVRKTPYQVKGVIIKDFPEEPIVPLIDGSYRDQFLYPRVQVKILNEQIYMVGIAEGVDPILSVVDKLGTMDFGNITFDVLGADVEVESDRFMPSNRMLRYKFLTPWIALNEANLMKYKQLFGDDRLKFLTRLLSHNIVFLAREMGLELETKIYTQLNLDSLYPKIVDDGQMGAFEGDFQTNFMLPNFLGVGNSITKGYGVFFSHFNPSDFSFDLAELQRDSRSAIAEKLPENWELEGVEPKDVPNSHRRKRQTKKNSSPKTPEEPNFNKKMKKKTDSLSSPRVEEEPNYNKLKYHSRKR